MTTIAQAAADRGVEPYAVAAWLDLGSQYHDEDELTAEDAELLTALWPA